MAVAKAIALTSGLDEVPGVTPRAAELLRELGVKNVGQLLAFLPFKHEQLEAETPIAELTAGRIVSARGTVTATRVARSRGGGPRSARFEAVVNDDSGRLDLVFFNQAFLAGKIHPGMRVRVQGKAARRGGGLQLANPKLEILAESGEEPATRDSRLRPVYPASEAISSAKIEAIVAKVLPHALPLLDDHLPPSFRKPRSLPELRDAYRMFHAPDSSEEVAAGRRRLAYDELLLLQLALFATRAKRSGKGTAAPLKWNATIDRHIRARFGFSLTPAQDEVVKEIAQDLQQDRPTNRLIQGDVGSGKTVVALYAMLMAAGSRRQAALMAPTELLAEQHHASMSAMLAGSQVQIALLTGSRPEAERQGVIAGIESGSIDLVIGTHALLTQNVRFKTLSVAVVDEQHRFGVGQRAALSSKGGAHSGTPGLSESAKAQPLSPHVLVMTATPIPRTLALTLLGDLDVSTIRGLPPGRKPVKTRVVGPEKAADVYTWVNSRLLKGEQAFIVAPAIDPAEDAAGPGALASVRELKERLERTQLAGRRLAVLHGQLSPESRDLVMGRFRAGMIDALIATTVIEVGVDVPNATMMIVEHAERFGLAQLHQLRGRIGRGEKASACVLIGQPVTPDAEQRLAAMGTLSDGFKLAEKDLEIRGFGEVVGVRQSGMPPFKVADLARDLELLSLARRDAVEWIDRSPTLGSPEEAILRRRLLKAHGQWLDLAGVA